MIPQAMHVLPELMTFIQRMKDDNDRGAFTDWQDFTQPIHQWFTPQRLQQIDDVVMGWKKMSSYADQATLIHLTAALVSLLGLPEYQALSPEQQNLALWIVLYHDVDKEVYQQGKRDHMHGFRSASVCGRELVRHGFVHDVDTEALLQWATLTKTASIVDEKLDDDIQDNTKLKDIIHGVDALFGGRDTPTGLIICGVLLHMSLNVVDEWPQVAPLTDEQIRASISPTLFPLLRVMMLTDNAAWGLFNPERHQPERQQLYREFDRAQALLSTHRYEMPNPFKSIITAWRSTASKFIGKDFK